MHIFKFIKSGFKCQEFSFCLFNLALGKNKREEIFYLMEWYLAVLFFALSTTITPGPNNIMLMSSGVNFGFKNSLPHLFGIAIWRLLV